MFGKNEIVGRMPATDRKELNVTSIFPTLQGEGPFSGKRAVFLRLAKCNLACSFCDTFFDAGNILSFDQIDQRLSEAATSVGYGYWGLVVTGGEPMLQDNLATFLREDRHAWDWVQIETNGILYQDLPDDVILVVSPKCIEKMVDGSMQATRYRKPHRKILERADCLKFVMRAGSGPYSTVPDWAFDWRDLTKKEIYVSPMNHYLREPEKSKGGSISDRSDQDEMISFWEQGLLDRGANQANHEYAANYALKHELRFQVQTHLYASLR